MPLPAPLEEDPETLIDFATLTGAARVAVGPEISAYFANDDGLASALDEGAATYEDPSWRLPLHQPYGRYLKSDVADLNNITEGAGSPSRRDHGCTVLRTLLRRRPRAALGALRHHGLEQCGAARTTQGRRTHGLSGRLRRAGADFGGLKLQITGNPRSLETSDQQIPQRLNMWGVNGFEVSGFSTACASRHPTGTLRRSAWRFR